MTYEYQEKGSKFSLCMSSDIPNFCKFVQIIRFELPLDFVILFYVYRIIQCNIFF